VEERLKRRLVGAVVLVSLAVIFLPMLVEQEQLGEVRIESSNIPPRPADTGQFRSSVLPTPLEEPLIEPLEEPLELTPGVAIDTGYPVDLEEEAAEPTQPRTGLSAWVVQVASLSSKNGADKLEAKLRSKGYSAFVEPVSLKGKNLYRVRVGPELDRKRADKMAEQIRKAVDLKGQVIRYP